MNVFCIWGCLGLINGFYGGNDCNSGLVYVFIIFKDLYLVYVLIFNLVFFKVLYIN